MQLPKEIFYRSNKTAWMTAALFEEYVCAMDHELPKDNRKGFSFWIMVWAMATWTIAKL